MPSEQELNTLVERLLGAASGYVAPHLSLEHDAVNAINSLYHKIQRIRKHWEACVPLEAEQEIEWKRKMREILDDLPSVT